MGTVTYITCESRRSISSKQIGGTIALWSLGVAGNQSSQSRLGLQAVWPPSLFALINLPGRSHQPFDPIHACFIGPNIGRRCLCNIISRTAPTWHEFPAANSRRSSCAIWLSLDRYVPALMHDASARTIFASCICTATPTS